MNIKNLIRDLAESEKFFVLCTQKEYIPYGSLIAYAFTDDLKFFFFATSKNTRKYDYLKTGPDAAFVIDNRCSAKDNFLKIQVLTASSEAFEIKSSGEDFNKAKSMLQKRHFYLNEFLNEPTTTIFRLEVSRYFLVANFQDVYELTP